MDWNLLIGGGIGIVSSIVTHFFNLINQNRRRKWELDDEQNRIKKEIIYNRIEALEIFIGTLQRLYSDILVRLRADSVVFHNYISDTQVDILPNLNEHAHLMYTVDYFNDEKLSNYFHHLSIIINRFIKMYSEFNEKLGDDEYVDNAKYIQEVADLYMQDTFTNILRRIDYIRENYRKY